MTRGRLVFDVEGSVRYHKARAAYFSSLTRLLNFVTLFLGTGVVLTTLASYPTLSWVSGLVVALISTYRLVSKPDQSERDHEKWCRDWTELLGAIESEDSPSNKHMKRWIARYHELNGACHEDMKAVKAHVYNETMTALGRRGVPYKISRFQRATKHILPHTHGFDAQNLQAVARQPTP